jgi:quinol monooxygenase YgiN
MTPLALIIKHKTQPGKREEVRSVWERHMAPAIAANSGHTAYFYYFDNADPDSICAFQEYASVEASNDFLRTNSYATYLKDVESFLAGPPEVTALTPVWSKATRPLIENLEGHDETHGGIVQPP